MRTHAAWRADTVFVPALEQEIQSSALPGSLSGQRMAVASAEPEDAHLTGMTRSLDRRLLALNLNPIASSKATRNRKVA